MKRVYNKYKNKRVVKDGYEFDSIKETNRYVELKLMEDDRLIFNLKLQPKYLLQGSFKRHGVIYRAIHYIADFEYIDKEGKTIVEDVKGIKTDVYKIKKKMFLFLNPDVIFREI